MWIAGSGKALSVCVTRGHISLCLGGGPRALASLPRTGQLLYVSGSRRVCVQREAWVHVLFLCAPRAPEFGKQQSFFGNCAFSRLAFIIPAISLRFTWVPPLGSDARGGRGKGLVRSGCREAELRGRWCRPRARPPSIPPPTKPAARGKWEF